MAMKGVMLDETCCNEWYDLSLALGKLFSGHTVAHVGKDPLPFLKVFFKSFHLSSIESFERIMRTL